jgi:hypothetical protein
VPHGSCAEPFARCRVPARVPAIWKRQEFVQDEADGHADAGGNDPREVLGEAGAGVFAYSTSKTTVQEYDIPCLLSKMSVIYQEVQVFGLYCGAMPENGPWWRMARGHEGTISSQTETAQNLASALERVAEALEGSIKRAGVPKSCV